MRDMHNLSVVITGASSGVGRCTAHAFARRGARVALAARNAEALEGVARECRELGGEAVPIPTDVTDEDAMRRLADQVADRFGGIDVWVNNAGVGAVGRFDEVPIEAHRRTVETNLLGYMYGAHAVLPHFRRQGHGVLINNGSVGAFMPTPYAASYAASKFGVRAFSNSLRQELKGWPDIHVCAIHPFMMDTPGVQHGANYTGVELKAAPPAYDPRRTAEAIVELVVHPRRQVLLGIMTKLTAAGYTLTPALLEWGMARFMEGWFSYADPSPATDGNLFEPKPGPLAVHGGWRWDLPRGRSGGLVALGLAAGLLGAGLAIAGSRRRSRSDGGRRYGQRPSGGGMPGYRGDAVRRSVPRGA